MYVQIQCDNRVNLWRVVCVRVPFVCYSLWLCGVPELRTVQGELPLPQLSQGLRQGHRMYPLHVHRGCRWEGGTNICWVWSQVERLWCWTVSLTFVKVTEVSFTCQYYKSMIDLCQGHRGVMTSIIVREEWMTSQYNRCMFVYCQGHRDTFELLSRSQTYEGDFRMFYFCKCHAHMFGFTAEITEACRSLLIGMTDLCQGHNRPRLDWRVKVIQA